MEPLALTGLPRLIVSFILGFAVGYIIINSRLAFRKTLLDQLSFKDNTFAIVFLVSVAIGIPIFYFTSQYNIIHLTTRYYQFWGIVIGAVFTGLGIALCGHIPITAIASFASGRIYSLWIFIGMLAAFPALNIAQPIVNDYVFSRPAPIDINSLAENSIFYDGKTTMLYLIPITCIILALFLRLIQPKYNKNK